MLTAEILYPKKLHGNRIVKCLECRLAYLTKDYKALAAAWKLRYFIVSSSEIEYTGNEPDIIVCHNCLFAILTDFAKDNPAPVKFKILTEKQEIELELDPELPITLQESTNMDAFLKSIDGFDADDTDEMPPREGDSPDWGV